MLAATTTPQHRFGVDALRVQLSERLVELTQKELPRMKEAIDNTLLQVGSNIFFKPLLFTTCIEFGGYLIV